MRSPSSPTYSDNDEDGRRRGPPLDELQVLQRRVEEIKQRRQEEERQRQEAERHAERQRQEAERQLWGRAMQPAPPGLPFEEEVHGLRVLMSRQGVMMRKLSEIHQIVNTWEAKFTSSQQFYQQYQQQQQQQYQQQQQQQYQQQQQQHQQQQQQQQQQQLMRRRNEPQRTSRRPISPVCAFATCERNQTTRRR